MAGGQKFKPTHLFVPLICLSIAGYFGYHVAQSTVKLKAFHDEAGIIKIKLAGVETSRIALEHKVRLLRPDSLDPDMLDERARFAINAANAEDIVIFRAQKQ